MKLLREISENVKTKVIKEDSNGHKRKYFLSGTFIQTGITNRNNREYPEDIVDKEVDRYVKENINENRAYGELGHPETPTIQLDRVSHLIRSLKKDGQNYVGKLEVLDTPNGNIVKNLIDAGASLGVSTRGVGSLKTQGNVSIVQDDYRIITAGDIVADPSAPDAFLTAVMEEKEWVWRNGTFKEVRLTEAKKKILKTSQKDLDEMKIRIFEDFLSKL